MLKMAAIVCDFEYSALVVGILTSVRLYIECRSAIMKVAVFAIAADGSNTVQPRHGRRVAHAPCRAARPESRDALLLTGRQSDHGIHVDLIEWIGILFSAHVRPLCRERRKQPLDPARWRIWLPSWTRR